MTPAVNDSQMLLKTTLQPPLPAVRRRVMPDVAAAPGAYTGRLDRVGMNEIEVPVLLEGADGRLERVPARAAAFVDLADPEAKGIHMSRLFLRLQEGLGSEALSLPLLARILADLLDSHADLSTSAHVELAFDWMIERPALVSQHTGWRSYPIRLIGNLTPAGLQLRIGTTITYSSTCPCSAALARQLIQEAFDRDFGGRTSIPASALRAWLGTPEAICATPHSQRSHADVLVEVADPTCAPSFGELIGAIEESLQTVVQAAVKREDEQAFARVNGQNAMFCEDAARRIQTSLDADTRLTDYRIRCSHLESLHPHDAVSVVTKGVVGGLRP